MSATTVQKLLLGLALLTALAWNLAHASEIKGLSLTSGATGTRAEIALDQSAEFKVISLKAPDRLVVDLPASRLSRGIAIPGGTGVVRSVRTGEPAPGTARIVFDLSQPVSVLKPRIEPGASGPRLVLEWPGDGEEMRPPVAAGTPASASPASVLSAAASTPPMARADAATPEQRERELIAASNEATSRLISELAARSQGAPAETAGSAGAQNSASAAAAVTRDAATGTAAGVPTTIATGAPTRIATGVPAAVQNPDAATTASAMPAQMPPANGVKTAKDVMLGGRGMRPLIIAIDAGHGGQDPGAIGPTGKREKDVVLAIAREFARQVNATPGMRAYLIRDNDVYVERPQRARRARAANADMFVSIHADAATNRTATGSSVFTLSTRGASSQYARWAADRENASDLVGGVRLEKGTLSSVLLDLAQTGHMKASQDAARLVLAGLREVGRNHKPQVEYANFEVLRNADMPAMLVETGFISNPEEERRLSDPAYQRQLARAVLDGVNTYFQRQPPPGTLYAARAAAQGSTVARAGAGAGGGSP